MLTARRPMFLFALLTALPLLLLSRPGARATIVPTVAGDGPNDTVRVTVSVNDSLGNAADADTVVVIWSHKGVMFDSLVTTAPGYRTGQYVFAHQASDEGSIGDYQVLVRVSVTGRTPIANFSYQVVKGGLFPLGAVTDSNLARAVTGEDYKADISACGGGSGAIPCTLYVMTANGAETNAVQGAYVRVRNSSETATAARGTTDAEGRVVFSLETATYHAYGYRVGYAFSVLPETVVIGTGGSSDTLWTTRFDPGSPDTTSLCRVYGWIRSLGGDTLSGAVVQARIAQSPLRYGNLVVSPYELTTTTDSTGYWYLDLFPSSALTPNNTLYEFTIRLSSGAILHRKLTVPDAAQWLLSW